MRIAILISQFLPIVGGAERQTHALAKVLLARGHQVVVVTQRLRGLPCREILDGVPVVRAIRSINCGPLFGLTYVLSAASFLLAHRGDWDVIHITFAYIDAFAAILTRRLHNVPVVVRPACTGHYGDLARLNRFRIWPLCSALDKLTIRSMVRTIMRADAFIANSGEMRSELVAAGFPADRILRIPNGVDTGHFRPNPSMRLPEARQRLGLPSGHLLAFVGRLDPQKGLYTLLKAVAGMRGGTRPHVLLLGDGPQREVLEDAVHKMDFADRVIFRGLVPDVAPFLQASDAFVFPSIREGMPNALLEAMASGLPCVASEIGGCTDVIADGQTGILVPAEDAAAFRAALAQLLQSATLRHQIGSAARESVVRRFGLDRMVDRYEVSYHAVRQGFSAADVTWADPNGWP